MARDTEARIEGPLLATVAVAVSITACASSTGNWHMQSSASAGAAIVMAAQDRETRIACRLSPSDLYVASSYFGGRYRGGNLTLRSGRQAITLPVIGTGPGIEAAGPATETWLLMLNSDAPIVLEYGGRKIRTPVLNQTTRNHFAAACGRSVGVH